MAAHAPPIRPRLPSSISVRSSSSADADDDDDYDTWDGDGSIQGDDRYFGLDPDGEDWPGVKPMHLDREGQGQGGKPPNVLSFSFGVPHLTKRQMVHLSFEPTWTPKQSASIDFPGQGRSSVPSLTRQQHDLIALPLAPLDLSQQLPPDLKRTRTARLSQWLEFGLGLLVSIASSVIASRVTTSRTWVSLTEPDPTLEFNGTLIAVAEAVFDATLLLEDPLLAPPHDSDDFCRAVYFSSINGINLCALKDLLPERPDIHQSCADFSQAHSDFRNACHPGSQYPAMRAAIVTVLSEIADGLQRLTAVNSPDDWGDDDVEEAALSTSAVRLGRRRRDAAAAEHMLGNLVPWRQRHFAALHTEIGEQERTLSIMVDRVERISQAFDHKMKRSDFEGHDDLITSRLAAMQGHIPLMRTVLGRLVASNQVLGGASFRLATHEAGLTEVVDAYNADRSRSTVLLRLGWIPAAPMLEEILSACTKVEVAASSFLRQDREKDGLMSHW